MKVLLGIGGSDDSLPALERTIERTREAGDDLTVAVVDNPRSPRSVEEVVDIAREELDDAGVDAEVVTLSGDPGSALVDFAEENGFDAIALGGGQRSPMGKVQVGGIAEFVLLNSRLSVTLVR
jgi:nucleotide-binding universal stress UspA family protein